jgi:hypothetical protein
MNFLRILIIISGLFVALMASFLVAAVVTGRDRRAYPIASPEDSLEVNGHTTSAGELAITYQPVVYLRENNPSPPLLWTWYEVVPDTNTIDITYYQNWENEINPSPTLYILYATFRAAYYGYPLYDIEFFQIRIDKTTGKIVGLLFETSPEDDFYVTISEHLVARYELRPDGRYDKVLKDKSGEVVAQSVEDVMFEGTHALNLAQTWNHLTRLLIQSDSGINSLESSLKFLSSDDYARFKFVRKSQGDHKTSPNIISLIFGTISFYGLLTIPVFLIRSFKRKKSNPRA